MARKGKARQIVEEHGLHDGKIIVELKSVATLNAAHQAQALHYLAATGFQLAILTNFGAPALETKRIVK
jgi:GxxExxY protein